MSVLKVRGADGKIREITSLKGSWDNANARANYIAYDGEGQYIPAKNVDEALKATSNKLCEVDSQLAFLNNYVTPEMYGAVGDGSNDDTDALQYAFNSGKPVVCCGEYKTTAPIVIPTNAVINCYGTIHYYGDSYALHVGGATAKVYIRKLISASNGVRVSKNYKDSLSSVVNANQVNIQYMVCEGFCLFMQETDVPVNDVSGYNGVLYNTFELSKWESLTEDCIHVDNSDHPNIFFNENIFIGGVLQARGAGKYAIYLKSTKQSFMMSSLVSANKFICTSCEGSSNGIYLCNSSENTFMNNRFEGTATSIKLAESSWDNLFKTQRTLDIKHISTEELVVLSPTLVKNLFEGPLCVGTSARATYRGYVYGPNLWSVEPARKEILTIASDEPVVLKGYEEMTTAYQFAENTHLIFAEATTSTLQISELYNNTEFEGFKVILSGGCTFKILDTAGNQVFSLKNTGTGAMYFHVRKYTNTWRRDS